MPLLRPSMPAAIPALEAIKSRQRTMWGAGDYARIGTRLQIVGEMLCETLDLRSGERVLDIAAGNGNASLAAARRFAEVTSTDYVPSLLEAARRRAEADGLDIEFRVADAEHLPFDDFSFDVVMSTFGVMFTPDADRAAREIQRVVRPGGRIGLASWTPEGFIGQLFRTVGSFVPPPAGLRSPAEWGTETRMVALFGPGASDIQSKRRLYTFRFLSIEHWIDCFRAWYGPLLVAYETLDAGRREELTAALRELLARFDRGGGRGLVVPAEYLEVVITR